MAERQERQRHVVRVDPDHGAAVHDVAGDVAVAQHDALRLSGGARRVDDRRQLVRRDGGGALLVLPAQTVLRHQPAMAAVGRFGKAQLLAARRPARSLRGVGGRIHDHQGGQVRELAPDRTHLRRLRLVGRHDDPGARVGEDVAHLRLGQRRVYRYGHRPGGQRRQVGDDPLGAAVGQDRDPVARLHPERTEPETEVANPVEELLRRQLVDGVAPAAPHERGSGMASDEVKRQCGQCLEFIVHGDSPACGGRYSLVPSHRTRLRGRRSRRTGLLSSSPVLSDQSPFSCRRP